MTLTMTQAEIDEQFSLDRIADIEAVMARRAEAMVAARAAFEGHYALPYGSAPGQTLNIFPAGNASGPAPVQVFIHGGFWRSLDADLFSFLASGFVPFGAMLVVIDYPLMPQVRMADVVASCQAAIAWVHAHAANYGGDPEKIFISGNSAGGHLVAELMDRTWLSGRDLPVDVIKGGTAISGIYDLEPVSRSFQNDSLHLTRAEIEQFSPASRTLDLGAPLIIAVGGDETEEFLGQSADFADQCRLQGASVAHAVIQGTDHITIVLDALRDPAAQLNQAVRRQMGLAD